MPTDSSCLITGVPKPMMSSDECHQTYSVFRRLSPNVLCRETSHVLLRMSGGMPRLNTLPILMGQLALGI